MSTFTNFIKDTGSELKQVNWPSRKRTTLTTVVVVVVALVVAYALGLFDFIFTKVLGLLVA